MSDCIETVTLIKGKEKYIYLFDNAHRAHALRMLGRHASNPELSFSWYDAAMLCTKMRQQENRPNSPPYSPEVTDGEDIFP